MKVAESTWESTKSITTCTFECESATIKIWALLWSLIQWLQNNTHMCFRLTNDNKSVQDAMGGKFTGIQFKYIGPFCVYVFIIHSVKQKSSVKKSDSRVRISGSMKKPCQCSKRTQKAENGPKVLISISGYWLSLLVSWWVGGLSTRTFGQTKAKLLCQGSYKLWQNSRCLPDFSKTDLF